MLLAKGERFWRCWVSGTQPNLRASINCVTRQQHNHFDARKYEHTYILTHGAVTGSLFSCDSYRPFLSY